MPAELRGWLLDAYADARRGIVLWLLGEDGQRYQLRLPLTTTFYAAGPFPRLRALWRWLDAPRTAVTLARARRQELFAGELDVLAITADAAAQPRLFRRVRQAFPDLDYYDADAPVSVQVAARLGLFPTLFCRVVVDAAHTVLEAQPLESRWAWERPLLPLRTLTLAPDCDPAHSEPTRLHAGFGGQTVTYALDNPRLLLLGLQAQLRRHDPDLILTRWGDTWLFPQLRAWAQRSGVRFYPSRDPQRPYQRKRAASYFSYGMTLYRGEQTLLYGRWHIDVHNALHFAEYDLEGVLEQARVSGMPVQAMARRSPGAGITAMQMITALRQGVLVPVTKQQAERYKSARALLRADRGGLVFQPRVGLHAGVVEIDFVSMYPSIIARFNVSPETVGVESENTAVAPELGLPIDQARRGLLPATLEPILCKRAAIKAALAPLDRRDGRYRRLHAQAAALKWLLVVAFGYAGYKRARFGRIEAHEAITAYSREALLRAKETAERLGYAVLHMYVDGLWVQKAGVQTATAARPLLDEIERATGLPIALEGVYRWIAFLPSKLDARVPVPNRYFGALAGGAFKARGIELRRHDTPPFVAGAQRELLELLARRAAPDPMVVLDACRPQIVALVNGRLDALHAGRVPIADLLVTQRLSRAVAKYRVPSPAARAAAQLQAVGKSRHAGQRVQFIFTRGAPGVYVWGLPNPLDLRAVDVARYRRLLLRAVHTLLQPWGVTPAQLAAWFAPAGRQGALALRW